MTEELLTDMASLLNTNITTPNVKVSVRGGASLDLHVTQAFLQQWRQFSKCSLEVKGGGRVIFPTAVTPLMTNNSIRLYAGVTLKDVVTSEIPTGIFSDRAAGLTLTNTTVGLLPSGVFKGATALYRLHILNSTLGVMEGSLEETHLSTKIWSSDKEPVKLINSTVGLLGQGALRVKMEHNQKAMLREMSVGRVESGGVQVDGGEVLVEQCVASRVDNDAVLLTNTTRLILRDNCLTLHPHALTQVPCSITGHRIYNNHFNVMVNGTIIPVTLTMNSTVATGDIEEEIAERKRLTDILSTVIHPSCISYNLGPLPFYPPPIIIQQPQGPLLTPGKIALFSLIGLCVGLTTAGLMVLCCKCCHRRRNHRPNNPIQTQTIFMNQLHQEPIYEECHVAPELPPPNCCSADATCSSLPPDDDDGNTRTENLYVTMKSR